MSMIDWWHVRSKIPGTSAWRSEREAVAARERAGRRRIIAKEVIRRLKAESSLAACPTEAQAENVILMLQRMGRIL